MSVVFWIDVALRCCGFGACWYLVALVACGGSPYRKVRRWTRKW